MPRLMEPDPPLPHVITMADALAAGLTRDQVRHRVRTNRWRRIAPGIFVAKATLPRHADRYRLDRIAHVLRAEAAAARYPGSVIGFESATLKHGLPLWQPTPTRPTLIVPPDHPGGTRALARLRYTALRDDEIAPDEVPVTTPARSWLDVARTSSLADALTVADAGLRVGAFSLADLHAALVAGADLIGIGKALLALEHASALRESPLESASWAYFVHHRLPLPKMQVTIRSRSGLFIARVDFLWEHFGLVGECDGFVKYRVRSDVTEEKIREDLIRGEDLRMARWGPRDLDTEAFAKRLRSLLC